MTTIELTGQPRTDFGKKATSQLRKEDRVPCVIYGGKDNTHFSVDYTELKDVVFTDKFTTVTINVDGKKSVGILKDVDFHPTTDRVLHVDFQELVEGTPVKVQIPVVLTGFANGVKAGGKLEMSLRKLAVKAQPSQLVESIEIDVTPLELGKSFKVRDLKTNLEVLNPGGIPIAKVIIPRSMRSAATKAASDDKKKKK